MTDDLQFEAFVRRYQDLVFGTAVRLLGNASDAEDAAQIVFLKAFERFDAIGKSPAAAGWLKTVTTNLCLNHLSRYRKRWQFFSEMDRDDGNDDAGAKQAEIAASKSAADVESAGRLERLERAVRELPAHQRVPLVLFHFEDKSYEEIASLLGVSLGKVKTDIHRGREALRKQFANDDE
jgi:RNA polymerase sigma-70 factor (ECF subfamily)